MTDNFKIHAQENLNNGELEIYIINDNHNGARSVCKPMEMVFTELPMGHPSKGPSLSIPLSFTGAFLQAMADLCHKLGVRPGEEPVLENELKAIKYHLEDMRSLVFKEKADENIPS